MFSCGIAASATPTAPAAAVVWGKRNSSRSHRPLFPVDVRHSGVIVVIEPAMRTRGERASKPKSRQTTVKTRGDQPDLGRAVGIRVRRFAAPVVHPVDKKSAVCLQLVHDTDVICLDCNKPVTTKSSSVGCHTWLVWFHGKRGVGAQKDLANWSILRIQALSR